MPSHLSRYVDEEDADEGGVRSRSVCLMRYPVGRATACGVWIGIEERVRAQIEAALHGLPEQLARLVPCGTIRRAGI